MLGAVETCMFKIVIDYSTNQGDFALFKEKRNQIIKEARELNQSDFIKQDLNTVIYKNKYYLTLNPRYCSCSNFKDVGICRHYVGACIITQYEDPHDREFLVIRGRGRPKKKSSKGALNY